MLSCPNLLLIGGNTRNSGKTTLACKIINKLSADHEVIGLKVTSIRPDEQEYHGEHNDNNVSDFRIIEEMSPDIPKDTSLMLRSGASKVFYILFPEGTTIDTLSAFLSSLDASKPIICESRSLRNFIMPGLFIMMMSNTASNSKKDVSEYLLKADKIFDFNEDQPIMESFVTKLGFINSMFVIN